MSGRRQISGGRKALSVTLATSHTVLSPSSRNYEKFPDRSPAKPRSSKAESSQPAKKDFSVALSRYRAVNLRRSLLHALANRRVQRGGRGGEEEGWRGLVENVCMDKKLEKVGVMLLASLASCTNSHHFQPTHPFRRRLSLVSLGDVTKRIGLWSWAGCKIRF